MRERIDGAGAQKPATEAKTGRRRPKAAAANSGTPGNTELLEFYRQMLLIRRFEERAGQLYGMGLIGGSATSTSAGKTSPRACKP